MQPHSGRQRTLDESATIRVLHVDDDPGFVETAARLLEREADRLLVETATNATEGLDRLTAERFDCVVSDYDMPGRNGIEFLEAVRETHSELPFVLFTGKGSEQIASEAISAGVTDYLQKEGGIDQFAILANRIANVAEGYRSRRALDERKRRLETLISNLPGIAYRCRNEPRWSMAVVEGECRELTGYSASALESGDVAWGDDVVSPEDREAVWGSVQRALATDDSFEVTYRIVARDGEVRWVWERGREVQSTDDGPEVIEGFITDVTTRKVREAELERLRDRSRALMYTETREETARIATEAANDVIGAPSSGVYLLDDAGGALVPAAVAETVLEVFGGAVRYPRDADPGSGAALVWEVFESGESTRIDDTHSDGRLTEETSARSAIVHPVGRHGVFVVSSGVPASFDDTDESLTELLATSLKTALDRVERESELRRQRDELQRRNERLDQLTSVVSHDLRNPLNVAAGHLELAREECESDRLTAVARAHDRMSRLIDELLAVTGEFDEVIESEPVVLAKLVEDCWRNVETDAARLVSRTNRTVLLDRFRAKQLFENLFRNATEHGGSDVTVAVGDLEDGFYLEDDGSGIPGDEREAVFDVGYSAVGSGTGFGLWIVEQVAEAHGWEIRITDSADGGARFEITGVDFADNDGSRGENDETVID